MTAGYLIGLDLGTSALKAALGHEEHGLLATSEVAYPMHRPHAGWAENDPDDWVRAAATAVPALLAEAGISAGQVAALCIVSQRDVAALVDRDGSPLAPCIHWSDRRDPDETEALFDSLGRDRLLDTSGTAPIPGLVLPNLAWSVRHQPDLTGQAIAAVGPKDYVAMRLTGEAATDRTTPTRSLLSDWRRGDWSDELCRDAGIPRRLLPAIRYDPWQVRAELDQRAALIGLEPGTLLAAGGGDDPSAALGCGVIEPGEISIGCSSSTSIRAVTTTPSVMSGVPLGILPHVVPGRFLHEMVAVGTGTSMRWLRAALTRSGQDPRDYADLIAEAARVAPGSDGLLFYPYVEGATVPYESHNVRAAYLGIEPHHDQAHLTRAAMEAIAFQYPPLLAILEAAGQTIGPITISDGEARSRVWNQLKADVLGRPLRVSNVAEAPAIGAAILAGVAAGAFADVRAGIRALTDRPETVEPDPSRHRSYAAFRERWERGRPAVFAVGGDAATPAGAPSYGASV